MVTRKTIAGIVFVVLLIGLYQTLLTPPEANVDADGESKVEASYSSWEIVMGDKYQGHNAPDFQRVVDDWKETARDDFVTAAVMLIVGVGLIVYLSATSDRPMPGV